MASSKESPRFEGVENRVQFAAVIMTAAFALLCVQLWRLQVVNYNDYLVMAEEQRVWPQRLKSDRGIIYGRDGILLADNRPSANVFFVPGECPEEKREDVCRALERLLGISADALLEEVTASKSEPFRQIPVKTDVTNYERVRVEERSFELPGVGTVVEPQRRYLYRRTAGQIMGYLNEIGKEELAANRDEYFMGDLIGRDGLEQQYESVLHGQDGEMVITKYASGRPQLRTDKYGAPVIAKQDSLGHLLEEMADHRIDPKRGQDLHITLDIELQAACEQILKGETGAIAVLDADTGAVLALASSPTYDPSVFVGGSSLERASLLGVVRHAVAPGEKLETIATRYGVKQEDILRWNQLPDDHVLAVGERLDLRPMDELKPMLNRCFREQYAPGSVFKVMLAAAALESGAIGPATSFTCYGGFRPGNSKRVWKCWRRGGHGTVSVKEALAYSCDVFFYNVGLKLGVDGINEWSRHMGLGEKTGIDLPREVPGLIPNREWKAALFKDRPVWDQRWYDGDTVNLSIGQGAASTTPLQNAVMMACIVNGGYRVRPFLNLALGPQLSERFLSDATLEWVRAGMRQCVEDGPPAPSGTGHECYIPGLDILGKTGSAQMVSLDVHKKYKSEEDIPKELRDHAWFVAGVMNAEPRIALCVLVEHGHHGSSAAAPLARKVIEHFYHDHFQQDTILAKETADGGEDGVL